MQINPHYIYNTLASIKWLIWQKNTEKSIEIMDAFIQLLRNTISNTDEYISLEQEIENLNNYILINNTRYGDRIKVEFYVSKQVKKYKIPKMILQPFIENAFFHAFPSNETGYIQVFMREKENQMQIEIIDDGVGMEQTQTQGGWMEQKKEHFSGIGMNNVDERLKLLFGQEYGVKIKSSKEEGTTVIVTIPKIEK